MTRFLPSWPLAFVLIGTCLFGVGCAKQKPMSDLAVSESFHVADQTVSSTSVAFISLDAFASPELVRKAFVDLPVADTSTCKNAKAGLVNHHTLATDLLAGFARDLSVCRPDITTLIILSPDHYHTGKAQVVTSGLPYHSGAHETLVEAEAMRRLLAAVPGSALEEQSFLQEHGIAAPLAFLAPRFPNAQVVPVLIHANISEFQASKVAAWLKEELKETTTFVVVSSDMSHYLSEAVARQNDLVSLRALERSDAPFFWSAKDGYTDNGKSFWIVLQAFEKSRWHLLAHDISTNYGGSKAFTTSYVTGFWTD